MYLYSKLQNLKKPIKIGFIGCGKFVSMFLAQYNQLNKIILDSIVELDIDRAKKNCSNSGLSNETIDKINFSDNLDKNYSIIFISLTILTILLSLTSASTSIHLYSADNVNSAISFLIKQSSSLGIIRCSFNLGGLPKNIIKPTTSLLFDFFILSTSRVLLTFSATSKLSSMKLLNPK